MKQYHGTDTLSANEIYDGKIDIKLGGGELGRGFYAGDLLYEALAWAYHKNKNSRAVIEFIVDDNDFLSLNPLCLDAPTTGVYRNDIRRKGETKSYLFNRNVIWTPVVGKKISNFNQMKYESSNAESYLNSNKVPKKIIKK